MAREKGERGRKDGKKCTVSESFGVDGVLSEGA